MNPFDRNLERFIIMTVIRNLPVLSVPEEVKRPRQPMGCVRCGGMNEHNHFFRYVIPKPVRFHMEPLELERYEPEIKEHGPLCDFCYDKLLNGK